MPNVKVVWAVYLLVAFVIAPVVFAWRYRRWPIVVGVPGRDVYGWVEVVYGSLVVVASVLIFAMDVRALSVPTGLVVFGLGFALLLWAMADMGSNWRIGQDPDDASVRHVDTRLYRVLKHPIYVALVMLAAGMVLLGGVTPGTVVLLVSTVVYVVVQGRAEGRYWRGRGDEE